MDESLRQAVDGALAEGRYADARALLSTPAPDPSRHPAMALRLARACRADGAADERCGCAKLAVTASPADPDFDQLLGDLQRETQRYPDALASYKAVLDTRPNDPLALRGSALVAKAMDMASAAEQLLRIATAAAPQDGEGWRLLGETELLQGKVDGGLASVRGAVAEDPSEANYESLLFHSLLSDHGDADERPLLHEFEARYGGRLGAAAAFSNTADAARPIRVGFLSSAMRTNHNSLYFMAPLLFHHDKRQTTLHLYGDVDYTRPGEAPLTGLVASACDTTSWDDARIAERMQRDGIDVLISALGRGSEAPRGRVLRFRAAPVQICFHHVMTTGYRDADYWIADPLTVPDTQNEYFSERILHIPWNFSFVELSDHGPVAPLPAARNGFVTFASTTQIWKINAAVLDCWRDLLNAVPPARLKIKALPFKDHTAADCRSPSPAPRLPLTPLNLCPPQTDFWQHMKFYNDVDAILDPFPSPCANTPPDPFPLLVPALSLIGRRFVG